MPSSPAPKVNIVHILTCHCSAQLRHTGAGEEGPTYILVQGCTAAAGCNQEMSDVNPKHIIYTETEVVQIQDSDMQNL